MLKGIETAVLMTLYNDTVLFQDILVIRAVIGNDYLIRDTQHKTLEVKVLDKFRAVPVIDRNQY
jgi:hypothetical protein